jgi:4-hydroxy-tetrahydrodipicolinate synthase
MADRHTPFHGIYPILYAYFTEAGTLDRRAMDLQVQACLAHGAHGIAILGLATEVGKLDLRERRQLVDWVGEAVGGRVPYAVTVGEPSVPGQVEFVRAAVAAGARWVILQPPAVAGVGEAEYVRFFGAVAERSEVPVAIQNAPGLMATSLSGAALRELSRQHPNVCLLKGEGPATYVRQLIEETEGRFDVFNGYGGLQLPNSLRAGCVGLIPAPDLFDPQVRVYELMRSGRPEDEAEAERLYRELLPLIVFMMTSVEHLVCYGKRLLARRLGLGPVHSRAPALHPTAFGLECVERYAAGLGPLGPAGAGAAGRA